MSSVRRVAMLLCVVTSAAVAQSTRPAAPRPAGPTQHDQFAVARAYNERTLRGAYDATGRRDPAWDAAARALLDVMAVRFADHGVPTLYKSGNVYDAATLLALADAAKACPDPLVGYCRAVLYRDLDRQDEFLNLLRDVGPKIIDGNYPLYRRTFAANALATTFPEQPQWLAKRDELAVQLMAEKTPDPRERRFVLARLQETVFQKLDGTKLKAAERQPFLDAVAAHPGVDAWMANVLRGQHEIDYAWECRGSGWASTVTDAGWAGFRDHIAAARAALTAAYAAEPNYPESAYRMITVCMADSSGQEREWFDRAIKAQIDYEPAWNAYLGALQPKWGGSVRAMYALGREAVATKRYDTMTPYVMLDVVQMLRDKNNLGDMVWKLPGLWNDVADMYDGYLTALPKNLDVTWNGSRRAAYAWRFGQYAEAKRTLDLLGEQVRTDAFTSFGVDFVDVRDEVNARAGSVATEIRKLDVQETLQRHTAAADGYAKLLAGMTKDDLSRPYCARREVVNRLMQSLKDGKPAEVPLTGPDSMAAWRGATDGWQTEGDALVFTGKGNAVSKLLHAVPLPAECRLRVEWQWTAAGNDAPGLDVVVRDTEREGLITVDTRPEKHDVMVRLGEKYDVVWWKWKAAKQANKRLLPGEWHTLSIRVDTESISIDHDDKPLIKEHKNGWFKIGHPVLGLVARTGADEGTVRVRRIVIEPADKSRRATSQP